MTAHHVGIFDGISSPLRRDGELPSGQAFARAAARALLAVDPDVDARTAVDLITRQLAQIGVAHAGPFGSVAAIYAPDRGEVWRVGDVHVAIDDRHLPGSKRIDAAMAGFRAAINAAALAVGTPLSDIIHDDPGLAAAAPLLAAQPTLANHPGAFGYGVLNGTPIPDELIETYSVPSNGRVVLASDGYLGPERTLADAERQLHRAIADDPACIGPLWTMGKALTRNTAAPDDRAYIRIETDPAESH
ncbi:hypothetical protein AB0I53_45795 [Saccharopolyspora sp. NPDC050389]|uniref:hypothetical protein n=1 Tax=Saccharopolyspora sp. NPDC050389 TaxID=3155516 RepID=UPI0033CA2C1A